MPSPAPDSRRFAERWSVGVLIAFALLGFGFGSWLSRLPAVRDHLGATTLEMSVYGLCLASGCLVGLMTAGRAVTVLGPRRTLAVGVVVQAVAMPAAAAVIWTEAIVPGLAILFVYGYAFATCDVAANVSGAANERALRKIRMSLFHASYSLGSVTALGLGALAERFAVAFPWHFVVAFAIILVGMLVALPTFPTREQEAKLAEDRARAVQGTGVMPTIRSGDAELPAFTTTTGSMPVVPRSDTARTHKSRGRTPESARRPARYSPWRDRRVLLVGLIGVCSNLVEGTASDWLPLALVDGRGMANDTAAVMLAVFFVSMMLGRASGSIIIGRFGRVPVIRGSFALCAAGVAAVILVPSLLGIVLGTIAWGLGAALGFPIAISAAADNPETAVRDVATVSAIAYTALLLGPMAFGFLGEFIGLLTSFWVLVGMLLLGGLVASAAHERRFEATRPLGSSASSD